MVPCAPDEFGTARPVRAPARTAVFSPAIVLAAFALIALAGVLLRPLLPVDETRYLAVAWEMHSHGDYLIPHRNGAVYPDKPPLLFWLVNLVWMLTGVSEIAARLIGPALAAGAIVLAGVLARRLWPDDRRVAGQAMLVLAGTSSFAFYGGLTMFDALLTCAVLAGLIALHAALTGGRWRHWAAFGAALGAGVYAKGPVIFLHLAPALFFYPVWARGLAGARLPRVAAGAALALAVAAALVALWLVPALLAGDRAYRDAILWTQTAGRMVQAFDHARAWWFYAAALPLLAFPWIWSPGVWRACRSLDLHDRGVRLCLTAGASGFILLSALSGKQLHYLLPELAVGALLVARATASPARPLSALWPAIFLAAVGAAALALDYGLIPAGSFGEALTPHAAVALWVLIVLAIAAIAVRLGRREGLAVAGMGLVLALNLLAAMTGLGSAYDGAALAAIAAPYDAGGIALVGSRYNAEFSFLARLTNPVAEIPDMAALGPWMASHPHGLAIIKDGRDALPGPPQWTVNFNGRDWRVWTVAGQTPAAALPTGP